MIMEDKSAEKNSSIEPRSISYCLRDNLPRDIVDLFNLSMEPSTTQFTIEQLCTDTESQKTIFKYILCNWAHTGFEDNRQTIGLNTMSVLLGLHTEEEVESFFKELGEGSKTKEIGKLLASYETEGLSMNEKHSKLRRIVQNVLEQPSDFGIHLM